MKQVFVGKAIKYASSKASVTTETALTPDLLADGAIGIYGLCNDGKTRLISPTTASTTGIVLYSDFIGSGTTYGGSKITVCRGVAVPSTTAQGQFYQGYVITNSFDYRNAISTTKTKENEVPLKNLWMIGYSPISVAGSLNLPTSLVNDTLALGIKTRTLISPEENVYAYDVALTVSEAVYDQAVTLVKKINADAKSILVADIVGDLGDSGTETTPVQAGGSYVFTKGSPVITNATASATTVIVGDYLRIQNNQPLTPVLGATNGAAVNNITAPMTAANSVIYKVIAVGALGVLITLDRPYTGETQTITVANFNLWVSRITTSLSTNLGIRIISNYVNTRVYPYVYGNLQSATIKEERGPSSGSGTYQMVSDLEKLASPYSGQLAKNDGTLTYYKPFPIYADPTIDTYDLYFTTVTPRVENSNIAQAAVTYGQTFEFAIAFPTAASSTGDNQYVYNTLIAAFSTASGDVVVGS